MKKPRLKSTAAAITYNSRDEVDTAIAEIGDLHRQREALATEMNGALATVKTSFEDRVAPLGEQIKVRQAGIQIYCEANRGELTRDGKTKTVKLGNGEVSWRAQPASVVVRGKLDVIIETLKKLRLVRFLRTKIELDKQAILNDPKAAKLIEGVSGLTIKTGGEDFVVRPFSSEIEEVA